MSEPVKVDSVLRWVRGHPECLRDFGDPRSVYRSLCELSEDCSFAGRQAVIFPGWVVALKLGWFGLSYTLVPMSRLLWSYVKRTQTWYVVFPVTDFSVVIKYHDGAGRYHSLEIETDEGGSALVMHALWSLAPWHIMGYTDAIDNVWRHDKGQFLSLKTTKMREVTGGSV